ncbi:unnamed protein product [Thlaspi arvense]|uniref:Beta-1,2-xylosyltransferase n=1 Tax=Thlaspi arvense TaxID=13288 RepID=A0AAU9ST22_THLAR|nr:unnamed protein product [Thlaspi arvense]
MSLLLSQPSKLCFRKPVFVRSSPLLSNGLSSSSLPEPPGYVFVCTDPCRPSLGTIVTSKPRGFDGVLCFRETDPDLDADPKRISLPPLVTLPHCQTQVVTNVVVSSSSPEDEDCVVAVKFLGPQLSFCRPAQSNPEWINIKIENPCFFSSPVMFSKKHNTFRMPESGGHLVGSWDPCKHSKNPKLQILRCKQLPKTTKPKRDLLDSCYTSEHLVESTTTGETFLLKKYKKTVRINKGFVIMKTELLRVFRLDEEGNAVFTQHIGDDVIFLSKSEPFCVPPSSFPGMLPNQVYILDVDELANVLLRFYTTSLAAVTEDFVCEEWVEEPTLLVTRFEYANLFHTVTDWYSAYVSSRVTGLPNRPNVVFMDGHCTTQLEETWTALFSGIRYAKNFSRPVCFRHAVLSPLGYETVLFKGLTEEVDCHGESAHNLWQNPDNKKTARLSEFGEMIRSAFGFPVNRHRSSERPPSSSSPSTSVHNVLFVRREDYLAHPRHGGKVQSRLINEEEVYESLHHWVASGSTGLTKCGINLVNGLFAHMSMKDQVRAIQDASVIIGAHGAGLTHIVSATPNTTIFEIVSVEFRRPHFELIAKWKGLEYHAMHLANSRADPTAVIQKLHEIMKSLGC